MRGQRSHDARTRGGNRRRLLIGLESFGETFLHLSQDGADGCFDAEDAWA